MKKLFLIPLAAFAIMATVYSCSKSDQSNAKEDESVLINQIANGKIVMDYQSASSTYSLNIAKALEKNKKSDYFLDQLDKLNDHTAIRNLFSQCFENGEMLFHDYENMISNTEKLVYEVKHAKVKNTSELVAAISTTKGDISKSSFNGRFNNCDDQLEADYGVCSATYDAAILNCASNPSYTQCTNSAAAARTRCVNSANANFIKCKPAMIENEVRISR
jgi:hypothetical protein